MKRDTDKWIADISPFDEIVFRAKCLHMICVGTDEQIKICKVAKEAVDREVFSPFGNKQSIPIYNPMHDMVESDFPGGLQALDPFEAEIAVNAIQSESSAVLYRRLTGRHYTGAGTFGFVDSVLPFHMWSNERKNNTLSSKSRPLMNQEDEWRVEDYYYDTEDAAKYHHHFTLHSLSTNDVRSFTIPHFVSEYEAGKLIETARELINTKQLQRFDHSNNGHGLSNVKTYMSERIILDSNDSPIARHIMQRSLELLSLEGKDSHYNVTHLDYLGSLVIEHQRGSKTQVVNECSRDVDIIEEEEYRRFATIHVVLFDEDRRDASATHLQFPGGSDISVKAYDATLIYGMLPDGNFDLKSVFRQDELSENEERWVAKFIVSSKAVEEYGSINRRI